MTTECRCCGGRCGDAQPLELNRRDFLEKMAVGAAALTVAGQMTWADEVDALVPPVTPHEVAAHYPLTPPRVYRGKNLEAVGMPMGGIGTGSMWLDGQGRAGDLADLQQPERAARFPTASSPSRPRRLPARRSPACCRPWPRAACGPWNRWSIEGGYPIARLTFHDRGPAGRGAAGGLQPDDPLGRGQLVDPLRDVPSSRPATRATRRPRSHSSRRCKTRWAAAGPDGIRGVRFGGYGGNRNRLVRARA